MSDNIITKMSLLSSLSKTLTKTTRDEWISMSYDDLTKDVVEPLNMIGHDARKTIINRLDFAQFDLLTRKLWDAQDIQPIEESYNDEEKFEEPYERVLPIVILLEDILTIRMEVEPLMKRKEDMAKQLTLLNVILQPHLLDGVAQKINDKRNGK